MGETRSNPDMKVGSASADAFERFLGDRVDDIFYKRLLRFWRANGDAGARRFCINDADKFDDEDVKLFLEKELFDAGEQGLDKKTPWNSYKRSKAGLPPLFEW